MSENYQVQKNARLRKLIAERGINLDIDSASRGKMINALKAYDKGKPNPELEPATKKKQEVEDEDEDIAEEQEEKDPMKGKIRILVPNTEGEAASDTVFVGCNGRSWYIPKDKEVIVDKTVKNALDLAVETITEMENGVKKERTARRVPYQILEEGPD